MGETIRLTAADGHELEAYEAKPGREGIGGIVLVQEIFGLTDHIKRVVEQYADHGFHTVAPAMFDRIEPGIVLDYSDIEAGIANMRQLEWEGTLADVAAAAKQVTQAGRVAVVGYCWGGTVAYRAAADLDVTAAVAYYGGGIAGMLERTPTCPVMYHFGDQDHSIPVDAIERIRQAHPDGIYHIYPGAGHGFNCDDRPSFSPADAELAFERSVEFLSSQLSG